MTTLWNSVIRTARYRTTFVHWIAFPHVAGHADLPVRDMVFIHNCLMEADRAGKDLILELVYKDVMDRFRHVDDIAITPGALP